MNKNREKENVRFGKFLSLVLRHKPDTIGIILDSNGWTDVDILISKLNQAGWKTDKQYLEEIVATNSKQRYAFNEGHDKIRASQGHTVEVDLAYRPQQPPDILYHGTGEKSVQAILLSGLQKRERHHVHLSPDTETAIKVGQRHGKPVVLEVLAGEMYRNQYEFFVSENGVWLTGFVPAEYLRSAKSE